MAEPATPTEAAVRGVLRALEAGVLSGGGAAPGAEGAVALAAHAAALAPALAGVWDAGAAEGAFSFAYKAPDERRVDVRVARAGGGALALDAALSLSGATSAAPPRHAALAVERLAPPPGCPPSAAPDLAALVAAVDATVLAPLRTPPPTALPRRAARSPPPGQHPQPERQPLTTYPPWSLVVGGGLMVGPHHPGFANALRVDPRRPPPSLAVPPGARYDPIHGVPGLDEALLSGGAQPPVHPDVARPGGDDDDLFFG